MSPRRTTPSLSTLLPHRNQSPTSQRSTATSLHRRAAVVWMTVVVSLVLCLWVSSSCRLFHGVSSSSSTTTSSSSFSFLRTLQKKYRRYWIRRSARQIQKLRQAMDQRIDDAIGKNSSNIDICFVSSIFGDSEELADQPSDVSNVWIDGDAIGSTDSNMGANNNVAALTFRFFLFTNLENMQVSEGWTKIVKKDLNYRRFITKSRWPKFMGWKEPQLQPCQTIFYFDGHYQPNPHKLHEFPAVAQAIQSSEVGLAQVPHPHKRTAMQEFSRILFKRKDIPTNVEASLKWLLEQPDFDNKCTLYQNAYFGYNPKSPAFQRAVEFFWSRYSLEIDSWRDQPLWCYTLQHEQLQPMLLLDEPNGLFEKDKTRTGHNDHRYDERSDGKQDNNKKQ